MAIQVRAQNAERDVEKIASSIAQAVVQVQLLGSEGLASAITALFGVVESIRGNDTVESVAAQLVEGTAAYAIIAYAATGTNHKTRSISEVKEFSSNSIVRIRMLCEQNNITLDSSDVERPSAHKLFSDLESNVIYYFRNDFPSMGCTERRALFRRFVNEGWARITSRKPDYFLPLWEALFGPAKYASDYDYAWLRYKSQLIAAFEDASVFGEEASGVRLSQAYVPLRCWWGIRATNPSPQPRRSNEADTYTYSHVHVDLLETTILRWLDRYDATDKFRFISGGPGSGKSTFAKKLASDLAATHQWRTLFVPLQRLSGSEHLENRISHFLQREIGGPFSGIPALSEYGRDKHSDWLFIFDGLDELAKEGAGSESAAQDFASALADFAARVPRGVQARFIVLGRAPSMQEARRRLNLGAGKTLYVVDLMPFSKSRQSYELRDCIINGDSEIISMDQRPSLWLRWAIAKGKDSSPPPAITEAALGDITKEPLLAHLLIISGYVEDNWQLAADNRNRIYEAIFDRIWIRESTKESRRELNDLGQPIFFHLLQALGLAAWRGGGRTGDESAFLKIRNVLLPNSTLVRIDNTDSADLANVALLFYTRKDEQGGFGYEFVHKSFGEYLTARALLGAFNRWRLQLENDEIEFDEVALLSRWQNLAGGAPLTAEVFSFLYNEVRLDHDGSPTALRDCRRVVDTLSRLLDYVLRRGFPVTSGMNFRELEIEQRNAELALWCLLDIYGGLGYPLSLFKKKSALGWQPGPISLSAFVDNPNAVRRLLNRHEDNMSTGWGVAEEKDGTYRVEWIGNPHIRFLMSRLDLRNTVFDAQRYSTFNLEGCNLSNADLCAIEMIGWNLRYTNLQGADISHCVMKYVSLLESDVSDANFSHTKFLDVEFRPFRKAKIMTSGSNVAKYNEKVTLEYSRSY